MICFATISKQRTVLWFSAALALALFAGKASATVISTGSSGGIVSSTSFTPTPDATSFSSSMNPVDIGFALDFYGKQFTNLNINNDGTVSLVNTSSGDTAGPYGFMASPAISPSAITQGQGTYSDGGAKYQAFEVNWLENTTCGTNPMLQLLFVNQSKNTQETSDFDIQFNYNLQCLPDVTQFDIGYPTYTGSGFASSTYYLVTQSGEVTSLDSSQGGILFQVRSDPPPADPVPEPATVALIGVGLFSLLWLRRRPSVPAPRARS